MARRRKIGPSPAVQKDVYYVRSITAENKFVCASFRSYSCIILQCVRGVLQIKVRVLGRASRRCAVSVKRKRFRPLGAFQYKANLSLPPTCAWPNRSPPCWWRALWWRRGTSSEVAACPRHPRLATVTGGDSRCLGMRHGRAGETPPWPLLSCIPADGSGGSSSSSSSSSSVQRTNSSSSMILTIVNTSSSSPV